MDLQAINNELFYDLPVLPNGPEHVNIVLGAKSATGEVSRKAKDLIDDNAQFIFSGGVVMRDRLVSLGLKWNAMLGRIDDSDIDYSEIMLEHTEAEWMMEQFLGKEDMVVCVEKDSKNTGQNFQYIKPYIDAKNIKSANIITNSYHCKRALMTARNYLGDDIVLSTVPVNPWGINQDNWHEMALLNKVVKGEYKNIRQEFKGNYIDAGYCLPVNVEQEHNRITEFLSQTQNSAKLNTLKP